MSSHASLFLKKDGRWTSHPSRWLGQSIDSCLIWGPDYLFATINSIAPIEREFWWTYADWWDGACVVDLDTKRVGWFGGEDAFTPEWREATLLMLSWTWPGWHIEWLPEGLSDVAEWVGASLEEVNSWNLRAVPPNHQPHQEPPPAHLLLPRNHEYPACEEFLLSWEDGDQLVVWRSESRFFGLAHGPDTVTPPETSDPAPFFIPQDLPELGAHISVTNKTLELWWSDPEPMAVKLIENTWHEWTVIREGFSLDAQLERIRAFGVEVPWRPRPLTERLEEAFTHMVWCYQLGLPTSIAVDAAFRATGRTKQWKHTPTGTPENREPWQVESDAMVIRGIQVISDGIEQFRRSS